MLTGVDTDRLAEEKARGISIELGFAHLKTPGGQSVGIVDVPGHEKFIRNMVAGVCGIQAVMFVIAADEGIMPQTREHFDILSVLGVTQGVIVLTKCDLVDDEWLGLMEAEVRKYVAGSAFAEAPIVRVSAKQPESMAGLLRALDEMFGKLKISSNDGLFRLPIDRVFTLKGHGTIVTGTIASGTVRVGDTVEVQPQGMRSRVRSIESFYHTDQGAFAGQRAALNLPDVDPAQIGRGSTCCQPESFPATERVDCRFRLLKNLPAFVEKLKSGSRIRFYAGTAEVMGRVHVIGGKEIEPGQEGHVQLHLEAPVVVSRGDRYLVRTFSPMFTIGGGVVVDAHPGRHKRDAAAVERLEKMGRSEPPELVRDLLATTPSVFLGAEEISRQLELPVDVVSRALESLVEVVGKVEKKKGLHYSRARLVKEGAQIASLVREFHGANPLMVGMERAALLARYNSRLEADLFQELLGLVVSGEGLVVEGSRVREATFRPKIDPQTEKEMGMIARMLQEQGVLTISQVQTGTRLLPNRFSKVLGLMVQRGDIVKLPDSHLGPGAWVEDMRNQVVEYLKQKGVASTADLKTVLNLSRKGLIPLLEHFDATGLTVRAGNDRRLKPKVT